MKLNKQTFVHTYKVIARCAKKKSPVIFVVAGVAAMGYAVYSAAKAAPKAEEAIEQAEEEKGEELTVIEKVKVGGKYYISTALALVAGMGFLIGENRIMAKRLSAMEAAYAVASDSLAKHLAAESEHPEIMQAVAEKALADADKTKPVIDIPKAKEAPDEDYIDDIFDRSTGTMYRGSRSDIRNAASEINAKIYSGPFDNPVSVNAFRIESGLIPCDFGDYLYFDKTHPCKPRFEPYESPITKKLCYLMTFEIPPVTY